MNAVIQRSAHPLVVLERNRWITKALLERLSAYSGSIFLVTDLHCCAVTLGAQRPTPVLVLAGKPPSDPKNGLHRPGSSVPVTPSLSH